MDLWEKLLVSRQLELTWIIFVHLTLPFLSKVDGPVQDQNFCKFQLWNVTKYT